MSAITTTTNRLAREKSPYLLQHQYNPVDWFPWGEEAFAKARQESKPIFVSIGYSTCHWCHVMERESFESEEIAEYLNAHFVSIKVDREERPDVDKIYMTAAQAMAGQGGWPLNCVLTPELKPFFAGTYFPPISRHGRLGFLQVLEQIHSLWESRRGDVVASADELHAKLKEFSIQPSAQALLHPRFLHAAAKTFKQEYDFVYGGFGSAPKFPRPSQPIFLLGEAMASEDQEGVKMVLHTCDRMAAGGIFDQVGGGFHRYSVDAQWLTPHFEKMLYDNAQLTVLYLDAFLASGEARYAQVARETLGYIQRDMTHPEGGFYSAEDADSEGKEGKFYCWTLSELSNLLTPKELALAVRYYGITEEGNFRDYSDPDPLPEQNILSVVDPLLIPAEEPLLQSIRSKLLGARQQRVRPQRDDKIIASWNGMMLGAFARAFAVLGDETYRVAAEKNIAFLQRYLWDGTSRTLFHRWREGERTASQLHDDYANVLAGTLDLYEATLNPARLDFAVNVAESMLNRFMDREDGGFFQAAGASDLILRVKEDYDGAEPSGNSVAVLGLLRLGAITGREEFGQAAEQVLRLFAQRLQSAPQVVPHLMLGLDFFLEEPRRAVVAGNWQAAETAALLRAIHRVYQPHKVVLGTAGAVDPFVKYWPEPDAPTVFLCTGTACQEPTREPEKISEMLAEGIETSV